MIGALASLLNEWDVPLELFFEGKLQNRLQRFVSVCQHANKRVRSSWIR